MEELHNLRAELVAYAVETLGYDYPMIAKAMNTSASNCKCYYEEYLDGTWKQQVSD